MGHGSTWTSYATTSILMYLYRSSYACWLGLSTHHPYLLEEDVPHASTAAMQEATLVKGRIVPTLLLDSDRESVRNARESWSKAHRSES